MLILFDGEDGPRQTLRFIEEKIVVGLFSLEISTGTLRWSSGMFELFGFAPHSVTPTLTMAQEMTYPADRRPPGTLERSIHLGLPLDREFRIVWKSGRIRWLSTKAEILIGADGKPAKVIGVAVDTTSRHEARAQAEMSELRRLRQANATDGVVWLAQPDGAVMDLANWTERRGGESPSTVLGSGWLDLVHPDDRDHTSTRWKEAIAEKTKYSVDHRILQPDGRYRWNRTQAVPIMEDGGAVLEWVGVTLDIHERIAGPQGGPTSLINGAQIRGARGILNWAIRDLAEKAEVSPSTLRRIEEYDGESKGDDEAIMKIRHALEHGGIEFLFLPHGKPGVRLR